MKQIEKDVLALNWFIDLIFSAIEILLCRMTFIRSFERSVFYFWFFFVLIEMLDGRKGDIWIHIDNCLQTFWNVYDWEARCALYIKWQKEIIIDRGYFHTDCRSLWIHSMRCSNRKYVCLNVLNTHKLICYACSCSLFFTFWMTRDEINLDKIEWRVTNSKIWSIEWSVKQSLWLCYQSDENLNLNLFYARNSISLCPKAYQTVVLFT